MSRYIPANLLPPEASHAQIAHLRRAAEGEQIFVQGLAERYAYGPWKTNLDQIVLAILRHLEAERRIYGKFQTGSSILIPHKIQANLRLDEDSGEESDVYVEFVLAAGGRVYIRDAHSHGNAPRLPH